MPGVRFFMGDGTEGTNGKLSIKRSGPIYPIKRAERVLKGLKGLYFLLFGPFGPFGLFETLLARNFLLEGVRFGLSQK